MSNLIESELAAANRKMLKIFADKNNGRKLVRLTHDNVAIVEAMICNDSDYIKSSDINAGPRGSYHGSTAYWMNMLRNYVLINSSEFLDDDSVEVDLKNYLRDHTCSKKARSCPYTYEELIKNAVIAVDIENSTHINADSVGREQIPKRIIAFGKKEFLKSLWRGDLKLFSKIVEPTDVKGLPEKYKARVNTSFASKFCHYACFFIFDGAEQQDNYSIYDNILLTVLPFYFNFYSINKDKSRPYSRRDLENYETYRKLVDEVRERAGEGTPEISRNGFDHLLWYYHKSRLADFN
jgi:hypothetical protein